MGRLAARLPKTYFDLEVNEQPEHPEGNSGERRHLRHCFKSGAVYNGEWLNGMRDGVGYQKWPDGTQYFGEWRRGRAKGRGQMQHADGGYYTGEWVNGRAHGLGVYRAKDGHAVYEGAFHCDQRNGPGVEAWVDGSSYLGEFWNGGKSGFGEQRWPDGMCYAGGWCDNDLAGAGSFWRRGGGRESEWADEDEEDGPPRPRYDGQWQRSAPHGIGVYSWPDGSRYEGGYVRDRKHGFGVLTDPKGCRKEGFWADGRLAPAEGDSIEDSRL